MTKWITLIFVAVGLIGCEATRYENNTNADPQFIQAHQALVRSDYDSAISMSRPLTKNGDPDYEQILGFALVLRRGKIVMQYQNKPVPRNYSEAAIKHIMWSIRSPDDGTKEGIQILTRSAKKGNILAQQVLGIILLGGSEKATDARLNLDPVEGLKWFILAERGGDPWAKMLTPRAKDELTVSQVQEAYARADSWKPIPWPNANVSTQAQEPGDASERLRKLKKLFEDGLINEDDYMRKKKEIIAEL